MQQKAIVRMFIIHCSLNCSYKKLWNVSGDHFKFSIIHIHVHAQQYIVPIQTG